MNQMSKKRTTGLILCFLVMTANLGSAVIRVQEDQADIFMKPGFETIVDDDRLWVLKPGQQIQEKHISLIGAGPLGMTLKAVDKATALEYMAIKPGYRVEIEENRVWVLRPGQQKQEKHITLVGAGPLGASIKSPDRDTALEYLAAKPGFAVEIEHGRLWVLKPGQQKQEKHVTLVGTGPLGLTIKTLDRNTALEYLSTKQGFDVKIVDGCLWVFLAGTGGELPEKHITHVGVGPNGMTVKSPDIETLSKYLAARV